MKSSFSRFHATSPGLPAPHLKTHQSTLVPLLRRHTWASYARTPCSPSTPFSAPAVPPSPRAGRSPAGRLPRRVYLAQVCEPASDQGGAAARLKRAPPQEAPAQVTTTALCCSSLRPFSPRLLPVAPAPPPPWQPQGLSSPRLEGFLKLSPARSPYSALQGGEVGAPPPRKKVSPQQARRSPHASPLPPPALRVHQF